MNRPFTNPSRWGFLESPQYTRPEEFQGWKVPDVLLSGHHREIEDLAASRIAEAYA